jgi:DnaK suppressor protein
MPGTTTSTPKKHAPAKEGSPADIADTETKAAGKNHRAADSGGHDGELADSKAAKAKITASSRRSTATAKADALSEQASRGKPAARSSKTAEGYAGDQKFLDAQRRALVEERSTYVEQAESLRAEADSLVEEMEPGDIQFDEESGEGGTVTVDRERDLALSAQALVAVEEIDHALAKMEQGTYGVCESCGTVIPKNRLEALPYARLCIACKSGGLSRR